MMKKMKMKRRVVNNLMQYDISLISFIITVYNFFNQHAAIFIHDNFKNSSIIFMSKSSFHGNAQIDKRGWDETMY